MSKQKDFASDSASRSLLRSLHGANKDAIGAVTAFQGLYPFFGGLTNFGMLSTRGRALTFDSENVDVWQVRTGPEVGERLASIPGRELRLDRNGEAQYGRLESADGIHNFWIHRSWLESIEHWLSQCDPLD